MEKIERGGKVAVLISPGYGAGWSTWCDNELREWCLFSPELVLAIEAGDEEKFEEICEKKIKETGNYIYLGSNVEYIKIKWLRKGTQFLVEEHDGYESLITSSELVYTA